MYCSEFTAGLGEACIPELTVNKTLCLPYSRFISLFWDELTC